MKGENISASPAYLFLRRLLQLSFHEIAIYRRITMVATDSCLFGNSSHERYGGLVL